MKKALRGDSKTARWLQYAGAKNVRPDADPVPEGTGRPKFNQLNIVTTFTYRPRLVNIDAHKLTQFRVIVQQTHKQTKKETHRQYRLQYAAPQLARSVMSSHDGDVTNSSQKRELCRS